MNPVLESHIYLTRQLTKKKEDIELLDSIVKKHMEGENVMKDFKELMARVVQEFVGEFQEKRNSIMDNPNMVRDIIKRGNEIATKNAQQTLKEVMDTLYSR